MNETDFINLLVKLGFSVEKPFSTYYVIIYQNVICGWIECFRGEKPSFRNVSVFKLAREATKRQLSNMAIFPSPMNLENVVENDTKKMLFDIQQRVKVYITRVKKSQIEQDFNV